MSSEENVENVRAPEVVTINVARCKNLKGSKGEAISSLVRVEFGSVLLGESTKVEANTETFTTEYNFNATFECSFDDPTHLDSIAHKPVIITVTEVLPKDKKGKEEKTNILGQTCVDLLPLLQGESTFTVVQSVQPVNNLNPLPADTSLEQTLPEIEITVSVAQPLLREAQLDLSNLVSVCVDSAYSIPEAMQPAQPFLYTVSLPIPLSAEKENTVVLPNGILRTPGEKEPANQRKWSSAPSASGTSIYIPASAVHEEIAVDEEDGDLKEKEDVQFRLEAMHEKNHITWNAERRCFLSSEASESLQAKIAQNRYWPIEIMRTPLPQTTKSKGKQTASEEEVAISYHGVAYVNMAPLLYPGVTRIRGAYLVKPYLENEVLEKTKRKGNLAEEAARIASGMSRTLASAMAQKLPAPSKQGKNEPKPKPSAAALKPEMGSDIDTTEMKNVEGQQYLEARTFITLEIKLSNPLVPKRPPSSLARKVAEYIPPRPVFARKTGGSKKAIEDYHNQVTVAANSLLEEFRQMFGNDLMGGDFQETNETADHRRRKIIYELNTSGKYFAFKEQLKLSVIKLVREKYLKTSAFTDKEELQAFLSELYIFLVDQMHQALSKFLSADDSPEEPPPVTDSAMLKHFAREAEVNQNYELAAKYYQERLARSKNDASHWFDYGAFCLLIGDIAKAEECFKETIALNQRHVSGLLLYGCVSLMLERYEEAETFLENATCVEPKNVVAWTLLGLYYDSIQNDIGAERAFLEANRLNVVHPVQTERPPSTEQQLVGDVESTGHIIEDTTAAEDEIHTVRSEIPEVQVDNVSTDDNPPQTQETEQEKQDEMPPSTAGQQSSTVIASETQLSKHPSLSKPQTQSSSFNGPSKPGSAPASAAESTTVVQENEATAEVVVEEVKPQETKSSVGIFLQTATFLLEVNALQLAESALAHELVACSGEPSAEYYITLGRLKIQQMQYEEAEDKLKQAIVLNHQNPDCWALIGHLNYLMGKTEEARENYERTLSYITEASDMHAIYLRLASIYLEKGQFQQAKDTFLKACVRSPSCVSWLGVGIASYRLGDLMEAEDALSEANILNNKDPEVWGYLSLVCLNTTRQLEAEQAYKYALKLNLKDENLLNEIHDVQERVGFGNPIVA
ncbi:cilia- and flagella-associated protein 70-like [Actinia tenebrosa]|uniref:Cilia- and flagella-associated protein 70-like n=1 Tax=Actinia tenebrosa TaxID=6105 RepID=A0A6P8HB54_ACTTE|nr:cilia- and flagella-associated protein 70-like [Actinia tenebrosa]